MNILIWNMRGLNDPSKQREVKSMVKRHFIGLLCLIETKVKERKADHIRNTIVLDWGFIFNYEKHLL
jgi:exonuclease III